VLLAMLTHAAGNAASQWLSAMEEQGALTLPQTGLAGWLVDSYWLNVIAYGAVALLLIVLTRGRLGVAPRTA